MKGLTIAVFTLFLIACQPIDLEKEKLLIQAQIDLINQAHWKQDALLFFAPNASTWIDVRGGTVNEIKKEDLLEATQEYLSNMQFQELISRDVPRIEISDDGTLASYIGSVTVKGMLGEKPVYWPVSWQSVLRKFQGEWKIISSANTEADERTSARLLLAQVRENLGISDQTGVISIAAHALCHGPLRSFETLVFSRETDGRLEQIYGDQHIILKHGVTTSWTYNVNTGSFREGINDEMKSSIIGHELHWLSLWPEHRYAQVTFKGITRFNNEHAFHLEMKNENSRVIEFYYSFESYLPLGFRSQVGEKREELLTVTFDNWDKTDGIALFRRAEIKLGEELFEYDFTDLTINQLNDKLFESKIASIRTESSS